MEKSKALILFTRLPDYFYQALRHFSQLYNFQCTIVHYPGDVNTSFNYQEDEWLHFISREDIRANEFINKNFSLVYSSSWRDKEYKAICKHYRNTIPVIIGMDNPWYNSPRQWLHVLISSITIKPYFNRVWICGTPQLPYARKLGFSSRQIMNGLYTADTEKFNSPVKTIMSQSRIILYVGRFVEYKNPVMLAEVFQDILLNHKELGDWQLLLTGRGPLLNQLQNFSSTNIKVQDFVSPDMLPELMRNASVFCLPSQNEHWGVVVHEAVCSGLPLILSDTVGAGSTFLEDGENGFLFKSGSGIDLKNQLLKIMSLDAEELRKMSDKSIELSKQVNKETWSRTLFQTIKNFNTK